MELYNVIANWVGWPTVVALLLLGGAFGYWILNKHIELLKEKNTGLEKEIENLKENTPDVLAQRLAIRHKLLTEELERLNADHQASQADVETKKMELEKLRQEIDRFEWQLSEADNWLSENDLVCPQCNSPLVVKEYNTEYRATYDENGYAEDIEIEHEHIVYDCGYELIDGEEIQECSRESKPEDCSETPD